MKGRTYFAGLSLLAAFACSWDAHAERMRLYEEGNYVGSGRVFMDDVSGLKIGGQTPRFESAKIITGRWLLCTSPNYSGDCLWISKDTPSFRALGYSGTLASLRPERVPVLARQWGDRKPPGRSALVFFSERNFAGEWTPYYEDASDLSHSPIKPLSIVIQKGAWRLCSLPNYEGDCISMTASSWDMPSIFGPSIRSAKRLDLTAR